MFGLRILFPISIVFAFMMNLVVIYGINDNKNNNNTNNADNDILSIPPTTIAFAQTMNSNKTQLWLDKENNAKIIFTYNPDSPIIGNPTKLLFSVQDLHTGDEIKGALHVRIIITNGHEILKITNATFAQGNFSTNYAFPDSGSYQVISKIDSNNVAELASFNVFVPPQALSSTSKSFFTLMLYYVIPATSSAAGIAIYLSHKKRI
jgi:hypothetical protein